MDQAQIASLFATAKTQLTTITNDVTTLQNDLRTMESLRLQLANAGGNAAALWLKIQLQQLTLGFQAYPNAPEGAARVVVFGTDSTAPRDLSQLGDRRPISALDPSLA